ncbi:MAG TPA: hypothetical protein VHN79_02240 [Lacunisphaera sp.]|nr:hypothetical protein [Lacunisphaera sp.]
MPTLLDQLADGPVWAAGRSARVAAQVLAQPEQIDELFDGLADEQEGIRNRAARALEEISAARPELLLPYKRELLTRATRIEHWIVRSHLCHILPRLGNLTTAERRRAIALLRGWMASRSIVTKVDALEGLVRLSLAPGFAAERAAATALLEDRATHGDTPALRARARILHKHLAKLARGIAE